MLCKSCFVIFDRIRRPGRYRDVGHQATYQGLETSALEGCQICSALLEFLRAREAVEELSTRGNPSQQFTTYDSDSSGRLTTKSLSILFNFPSLGLVGDRERITFNLEPLTDINSREFSHSYKPDSNTDSSAGWALVQYWLDNCTKRHFRCRGSAKNTWMPSRLLDLGPSDDDSANIWLCVSTGSIIGQQYMTLSHCWGKRVPLRLTKSNIEELQSGILLKDLPKTFTDAVRIAKRFGVRYLWIDSLCIIQESVEDWRQEAAVMGEVYRHSFCNIAATGANDSTEGCFFTRDPNLTMPTQVTIKWDDWDGITEQAYQVVSGPELWSTTFNNEPLNRRAWVLQERMLSPRVIHFGRKQLWWECHALNACESYPDSLPGSISYGPMNSLKRLALGTDFWKHALESYGVLTPRTADNVNPGDLSTAQKFSQLYMFWATNIEVYSTGGLSRPNDKLIALSGIATEMQRILSEDHYLAGLWRFSLPSHLLWVSEKSSDLLPYRTEKYRAPTWSWASVEGRISFSWCLHTTLRYPLADVLDAQITNVGNNKTGEVASGFLRIKAPIASASFEMDNESETLQLASLTKRERLGRERKKWLPKADGKDYLRFDDYRQKPQLDVTLLPLYRTLEEDEVVQAHVKIESAEKKERLTGLILKQTEHVGEYERLGVFSISHPLACKLLGHSLERTVILV